MPVSQAPVAHHSDDRLDLDTRVIGVFWEKSVPVGGNEMAALELADIEKVEPHGGDPSRDVRKKGQQLPRNGRKQARKRVPLS